VEKPAGRQNFSLFNRGRTFLHVRLQAPLLQFKSLGLDTGPADEFGGEVKSILNGLSSPFDRIDIQVIDELARQINQL